MATKVVETLEQFIQEHNAIEKEPNHLFFYRGHGEHIKNILPFLFRKENRKKEEHLFYKNAIKEHPGLFCDDKTTLEKLVRMQHYGIPTRLLDITQNPLVALYFACCDKNNKEDGEVVVLSKYSRKVKYYDSDAVSILSNLCKLAGKEKNFDTALNKQDFNRQNNMGKLFHAIKEEKSYFSECIVPDDMKSCFFVYAKKNNDRISAQDGLFIIYGIESNIDEDIEKRLVIDKNKKESILNQLAKINIAEHTLFPELEKTATYLKTKYGGLK